MLHPHVPEELKSFSKHLLATFLGLLMALGLEGWRERQHAIHVSEESLGRIEAELAEDREDTARRLSEIEAEQPLMEAYCRSLEQAVAARRQGRKTPFPLPPKVRNPDFDFTWSAWETARSTGSLRYIDTGRLMRLSAVYTSLQRFIPIQDQIINNPAMADLMTFAHRDPAVLTPDELGRMLNGYRFNQMWTLQRIRHGHEILGALDAALKP